MNNSASLLEYLTCADPLLRAEPSRDGPPSNTKNEKYPRLTEVVPWRGFTANAIRTMFGGRLQQHLEVRVDGLPDFPNLHPKSLEISGERSLDSLVGNWHQQILLQALERTSQQILGQKVYMVKGAEALLAFDDTTRFGPDWAGTNDVQREDQFRLPNNILPGDTKTSWNWSSDKLMVSKLDTQWPIRQLLFYCVRSCCRYGYLITNKELVAIRVSRNKSAPKPDREVDDDPFEVSYYVGQSPSVEFLSIPWSTSDSTSYMTINLALWVLHILAANNGRLQIKPYTRLGQEKCIPRENQVAVPRVSAEKAKRLGRSAKDTFDEQSYVGSPVQEALLKIASMESDTEVETQGDSTDNEDAIQFSQPNSVQSSFGGLSQSAKRKRASNTTTTRNSRRKTPEQPSRDSSRPRRSTRKKTFEENQRYRVSSSSRTRA